MLRDIINTYRQAFRLYIRQRTRPLTIEEAEEKRLFWSKCYAAIAVFTGITATYITARNNINFKYPEGLPKEQAVIEKLIDHPVKVYKFQNFSKVDEYIYTPSTAKKGKEPLPESNPAETSEV